MNSLECLSVRKLLGPFVDDELTGADRLRVFQHLDQCPLCGCQLRDLTAIGNAVRSRAESDTPLQELAGLAAGVVSRSRAEADLSWRRRLWRASEDWHWVVVGVGSLAATLVSTLALTAILKFGPEPERQDSVAGYYTNPGASEGVVLAYAARPFAAGDIELLSAPSGPVGDRHTLRAGTEADLVDQLAQAVTRPRRGARSARLDRTDRIIQEALLFEIIRLRLDEPLLVGRQPNTLVNVSSAFTWDHAPGHTSVP